MIETQPNIRAHIRWLIRRDMPEVLAIENASFDHPWTEEEFLRVLRQRNCIGMVAELGDYPGRIAGFMVYELHKHHLHIVNFAVHPDFRRHSVGRQMVDKLVDKLSSHRRTRITLNVRETNLAAQLFYRSQRFMATEVVPEYYTDSSEAAYAMEYRHAEASDDV